MQYKRYQPVYLQLYFVINYTTDPYILNNI